MSDRVPPIARIRLSRSLPRLLLLPFLGVAAGLAIAGAGTLLALPDVAALALVAVGGLMVIVALVGALMLLSIRLDVEEAAVSVRWLGGARTYPLSPGPITRVRLRGADASRLRARRWGLGWQLGAAVLRGEESIEVVRLARTATAILVPTERGRLAIAAADEAALLDGLARAARARQRLEAIAREAPGGEEPEPSPAPVEVDPRLMTGIERAVFERRVAEEREAAELAAAEAARRAAALPPPAAVVQPAVEVVPAPVARRRRLRFPRPTWRIRPGPPLALLVLPLAGAGIAWGAAVVLDRMPEPGSDLGRLTALALVLAGPATTVGAILARFWWPRIVGVVVAGGLAAAVFVGRALLG